MYVNVHMNSGETANTWIDALSASFAGVQVSKKTKRFLLTLQTQALALYNKDPCFPVKTTSPRRLELMSPTKGARERDTCHLRAPCSFSQAPATEARLTGRFDKNPV